MMKPFYFAISALACVHLSMALTMHTQKKNLVPQDTELQRITSGSALFDSVTQPALTISALKTVAESISAAEKPQELHKPVEQQGAFKEKGDKCVVPPPTLDAFKKSDRGEYNGMLFGTGFRQSPTDVVMTTRICTNECCDRCPSDNTIAIGHVSLSADGSSKASKWLNVTEVDTQHEMRFIHSGPEDPRLYTSGKSLNILTTIGDAKCDPGLKKPNKKMPNITMMGSVRKMHHVSLNEDFSVRKACKIDVPELPACETQKNWMPLPIGEEQFFVYSVKPFQLLKFDPEACQAKFLESPTVLEKQDFLKHGTVRGSSSFVVGKTSEAGTVYVALGHAAAPYPYHLIAVLVKPDSPSKPELIAVSCSQHLNLEKKQQFAYPTSILSLNYEQNQAELMFHIDDREVISAQMKGISKWIDDAEKYFHTTGKAAIC